MMNTTPNVIGQGTYGCVHNPSLKCKDSPGIAYRNKVSKLLKTKDAKTEINEYKKLINADKKKDFYLGVPDHCDVDNRLVKNLKAIQKCSIGKDVLRNISGYKLLVMNDGGVSLEKYTKEIHEWTESAESTEKCERFLLESLRLFNGLIHHDLKPHNIVYNLTEQRLNFIDFGLMISRDKLLKKCAASSYDYALFHWSYPWELEFINKNVFDDLITDPDTPDEIINSLEQEIAKKSGSSYEHIKTFFYYVFDNKTELAKYQADCAHYLSGYGRTIKDNSLEMKYQAFTNKCVKTIDGIHINDKLISYNVYFDKVIDSHSVTIKEFVKQISNKLLITYENCTFNVMAQYYDL